MEEKRKYHKARVTKQWKKTKKYKVDRPIKSSSAYSVITIKEIDGKIGNYKISTTQRPSGKIFRTKKAVAYRYINNECMVKRYAGRKRISAKFMRMKDYTIHNIDLWVITSLANRKDALVQGSLVNKNISITNGKKTVKGEVLSVVNVGGGTTTPPSEGGLPPIDE